jgi:small subunit ribosomal protein S6
LAQNVYEGMFILDANRYGREAEALSTQISAMIQDAGGEILVSRCWEERRLAYPINGHRKGVYWLTYFRLDSVRLGEIKGKCQITEAIIRVLFLKVEPRLVETLVAHARAGTVVAYTVPAEPAEPPIAAALVAVDAVDAWDADDAKPGADVDEE